MPISPPRVWVKEDIPTAQEMGEYLSRVRAVRDAFPMLPGTPEVPPDMDGLTYQTANEIEMVLLQVDRAIDNMKHSWIYSGELTAGGF